MKHILVNGLKSSAAGGKNIFDNYLKQVYYSGRADRLYYILTPDAAEYKQFSSENVIIVDNIMFRKNIWFLVLYYWELPKLLHRLKIDVVINFGDVIIPTKISQIYFFDWAYAVYDEKHLWRKMRFREKLVRRTKVFLISKYIKKVYKVIAQTRNMANRLGLKYNIANIDVIPTPISIRVTKKQQLASQARTGPYKFLFPASFSYHKNFGIVLKVGSLIDKEKLPFEIVLTVDEIKGKELLAKIENDEIKSINNMGPIPAEQMEYVYQNVDALLFPTLLESYGLPYFEAMLFEKPIFTSDLDFANDVCGGAAFYFDPFDARSVLNSMKLISLENEVKKKISVGYEIVESLPDWAEVFKKFEKIIDEAVV